MSFISSSLLQDQLKRSQLLHTPIEFFNSSHIPHTIGLIINHYISFRKISSFEIVSSNFQIHLTKLLEAIVQKNMSFVIKEQVSQNNYGNMQNNKNSVSYQILAVSLNLDIKDFLTLFQTELNFSVFEKLGMITVEVRNSLYKYADCQKGQYLINIQTILSPKSQKISDKVKYICKGFVFCKAVGWKNILYATKDTQFENPYILIKLGGEIKEVIKNNQNKIQSLMNQNEENSKLTYQTEGALKQVKQHQYTYLIQLKMINIRILTFKRSQQNYFEDSYENSLNPQPKL